MSDYLSFCKRAFSKSPLWWRIVNAVMVVGSLIGWLSGRTPKFIADFWAWWLLLIAILLFIGITWGASRIQKEQEIVAQTFRKRTAGRCRALIKQLADLDRKYLEAPDGTKISKTLQSPLAPGWGGIEHHWASQVCSFQSLYWSLLADMECYNQHSPMPIEIASHWALPSSPQVVTVTDLMDMLSNHKEQISKI